MYAIFQALPHLMHELPDDEARKAIVFAVWPTILGEHLRERSNPRDLENGKLFVSVSSAEWKREFEEHASEIVYKMNRALGASFVKRIEMIVDPKAVDNRRSNHKSIAPPTALRPPKDLASSSAKIADSELRAHFLQAAAICIDRRDAK